MCINASNEIFAAYEILSEPRCVLVGVSMKFECILPPVADKNFANFLFWNEYDCA